MWRFTDNGLERRAATFSQLVSLFYRPADSVRECSARGCTRAAYRDRVCCEEHEVQRQLGYYDPERGWSA